MGLAFLLEKPPDYVYRMFTDVGLITELYPDCRDARARRRDEYGALIDYRVNILLKDYRYSLEMSFDPAQRLIEWVEAGGDFPYVRGYWRILDSGRPGTSLMLGETYLDAGFPLPRWIEEWIMRVKSKEMVRDFRRWIAAHTLGDASRARHGACRLSGEGAGILTPCAMRSSSRPTPLIPSQSSALSTASCARGGSGSSGNSTSSTAISSCRGPSPARGVISACAWTDPAPS
jgi:ribosome-associated toxin RatA of RatAB toxin-antitoxin module